MKEIEFTLPIGYEDESGNYHKVGKIRPATALDEIEIHNEDKTYFNPRYHDILLLARVITKLGELNNINVNIIENLYEADFRYLQTLYRSVNGDMDEQAGTRCPECGSLNKLNLTNAFENIESYYNKTEDNND